MANIFIVEDELIIQERIAILLEELGHSIAGCADNADNAIAQIEENDVDVVLLDIALPGKNNGISLAKTINEELFIPIIFTSSFQDKETIAEAVETKPVAYLTKPINKGDLLAAIEMALSRKTGSDKNEPKNKQINVFYTKIGDKLTKIDTESILWLEAASTNYCDIVLSDGNRVTVRSSLQKMLKQLPEELFVQTHRQYAININFIEHINLKEQSILIQNESIPLGRAYKENFMNKIERF